MPTEHIVALLIEERDKLNRAIEALQGTKRRGRRANNVGERGGSVSSGSKPKTVWSAARKKAHTARMKAYWAKRKATKK
jgi:hypothetical protein